MYFYYIGMQLLCNQSIQHCAYDEISATAYHDTKSGDMVLQLDTQLYMFLLYWYEVAL